MSQLRHERERITFGDELRMLRKKKRVVGIELAKLTGISQSKLSKIETGALTPSTDDLQRIFGVLKPSRNDAQRLIEWGRTLRTEYASWRFSHRKGFGPKQLEVSQLEQKATRIRVFQPALIPGLLQIPEYARRVLQLANITHQPDLEQALSIRIKRQEILYKSDHKFEFLISESAALSRFCNPAIVRQQLERLRFFPGLSNVEIGFISSRVALPHTPQCSFVVLDSSSAVVETFTGEVSTVDPRDVEVYNSVFDDFVSVASFGSAASEFLDDCMQTLGTMDDPSPQSLARGCMSLVET